MTSRLGAATALAGLALAGPAYAATVGGLMYTLGDGGSTLVSVQNTKNPANAVGITREGGGALTLNELTILPDTGDIYGYSSSDDTFYIVDPETGVATAQATAGAAINDGGAVGLDFNNGIDAARLVTTENDNVVYDPKPDPDTVNTTDPIDLFYEAGDVNEGVDPNVFANAYTNAVPMPSTSIQYALDSETDYLTLLGNNTGTLTSVSQLFLDGVALDFTDVGGFDFLSYEEGNNTAIALLTTQEGQAFYNFFVPQIGGQANLTLLGAVDGEFGPLQGLAVAPVPLPAAGVLLLAALGGLGVLRRRAKA